ncbi:MAG: ATP-binding protein [Kiritimatiellae bacterium]|nr:ATP-binding protein [Kiritimatiellia bacterium]
MIERDITAKALSLWKQYPVLTITGPRQSGKTTLVRHVFPEAEYVNLEDPEAHELARRDVKGFLARHPAPAVFDEVQYTPDLLRAIQAEVDATGGVSRYVLTGSHQPALQNAVSQSLAGRTGLLELLPFSIRELAAAGVAKSRDEWLLDGFMPRLYDSGIAPSDLYRDYFLTYVERDVRQLANLRNLSAFETFVRLLAGRVGQLLNAESLSNDTGVPVATVRGWLSLLEASYLIHPLRPYYRNFGKRFVKAPKIYFTEPGLAAYLLGLRTVGQVATHPLAGNLFENLVVAEMLKSRRNRGEADDLHFMRTSNGVEADIVVEEGGQLDLYEVKAAETFRADMAANLEKLSRLVPGVGRRTVVFAGATVGEVRGTRFVRFTEMP